MRNLPVLVLCLAACGSAPKTAAPVGKHGDPASIRLPVADDATISVIAWFPHGAAQDPAGKEGLAWLTGALMSEGATQKNSYEQILKKLFPMAAGYSVVVDREMTTVRGRVHKDHVGAYLALFIDAYARPAFAAADIERLRAQGLSAIEKQLRYAQDEELGKAALHSMMYAGTTNAHPVLGTVKGLHAITEKDIRDFYAAHFAAPRVTFAIGGAFAPAHEQALAASRRALPAGGAAALPPPPPAPLEARRVLLVDKPGADASISFGFPIDVHRGEPDFYALWVANSWLGEHRNSSSHLYEVIREIRGLNYGDYSYIEAFPNGGRLQMPPTNVARKQQYFEVWIRTLPNEKAPFALRAGLRELRKLVEFGMTADQFELTRAFLLKYSQHMAPTTFDRLGYAVDDRFYGTDDHLARTQAALKSLTLAQVNQAIKRHLQVKNLNIAIVTGKPTELAAALGSEKPSTLEYPTPKPKPVLAEDVEIGKEPLRIAKEAIAVKPVDSMFE